MAALYTVLALMLLTLALALFLSWKMARRHVPDETRSPTEYGLPFEDIAFPAADGLTLRGWWIPGSDAERAIIMLHGQAGSMDPDVQYVPALHEAGFNVLMFDFRAHGRSDGRISTIGYLEQRDVLGAVAFVYARGIARIGLFGFSMGARVALLAAPLCPGVKAVVADGGPPRMLPAIAVRLQEMGLPEELARPLAWLTLAGTSLRVRANLLRYEPLYLAGRVAPRPVLFIHGGRDPYIPAAEFAALVAAAGPGAEVWRVPEAGHRTTDEVYPDEYRRRVVDFFQRHL
jgi:pimeloyl-ACP methyl ester carboxylesterase